MVEHFKGSFTQQEALPDAAIAAALTVLQHGRLHRYNLTQGEVGETALLEKEFAAFTGARFALAVASGGYALATALRALGVQPGDPVLSNAFTLAPVPGAIASVGAKPVFVEITESLTVDADHLAQAAKESGAKVLLLSHMRGHQPDMPALMAQCDDLGLSVIEDCAHTMGGTAGGTVSGRHGVIACYSMQTYKHINSGEGGFLITDDEALAARAVLLSGSYMFYERNGAAPSAEAFEDIRDFTPNISGRMDNLRAAILRPQLADLSTQVARWAALHDAMEEGLGNLPKLRLIDRDPNLVRVGSSFQFRLPDISEAAMLDFVARCGARGVVLKWFGARRAVGFTSTYRNWAYAKTPDLPKTDRIVAGLLDMRLPLTFSVDDCALIARIIADEAART